jgi:hypothetical protein
MKSRGKSTPYVEFLIVVGVLLPVSACTWANPWRSQAAAPKATEESTEVASGEKKKEMPKVKLTRDEQNIYDRYHTNRGSATGLDPQSRDIESRLGYK